MIITGGLLWWFEDYFSNRQQSFAINGQTSEWGDILAGVPQGSVLWVSDVFVYIDDLTHEVQSSKVMLFAANTICISQSTTQQMVQVPCTRT